MRDYIFLFQFNKTPINLLAEKVKVLVVCADSDLASSPFEDNFQNKEFSWKERMSEILYLPLFRFMNLENIPFPCHSNPWHQVQSVTSLKVQCFVNM